MRAQRECRLRPHYSDPMPADATKRKQLEMKIAAAACLHSQRRDRDSGEWSYISSIPVKPISSIPVQPISNIPL